METTRAVFAQEHLAKGEAMGEARGEAKGEVTGAQVAILFFQKKSPKEISDKLQIPLARVTDILRKSGLIEQSQ